MRRRLFYSREIPFPMEQVWPLLDFPAPGWALGDGGPREIGNTRSMDIPGFGLVVDELVAYQAGADRKRFTYALINDDNPLGTRGYEGTLTLVRNTTDPSRCFLHYAARWDEADQPVAEVFPTLMNGMIDQLVEGLAVAS